MDTSVDHLFKNGEDVFTAGAVSQQQDAETPTATPSGVDINNSDKQKTKLVRYFSRDRQHV